MIIYKYNKRSDNIYIIHIKKNISKCKFLKKIKVKSNCFGGLLFSRIYDSFFSEIIDLNLEYRKYHNCEYNTFNEFLQKKYNIPKEVALKGEKKLAKFKNTSLFFKKEDVSGDYNLESFIMSEEGFTNIVKGVLGVQDEN